MPNTVPKTRLKSNPKTHLKTGDSTESTTAEDILNPAFMQAVTQAFNASAVGEL